MNKTEKAVIDLLIIDNTKNAGELAEGIGVTKRTVERAFVSLQKKGLIERIGSRRDGVWSVIR